MSLTAYGWTDALQHHFDSLGEPGLLAGRILVQQRSAFRVASAAGEIDAQMSGRFAYAAAPEDRPVAGDWVAFAARPGERAGTIHHVLARTGTFTRRDPEGRPQIVGANLDVALLVQSLNGDLNPRRLERYLALAREGGVAPVIVLTKADVAPDAEARRAAIEASATGAPIIIVSALTGQGLTDLAERLAPGKTAALLGSSGAGKSTLVNALAGAELMATRAISGDGKRGRHTTTHRELILLPSGALLLDSPGMREIAIGDAAAGVEAAFADIEAIAAQCRFTDCAHAGEPGCAIAAALESGALAAARWASYQKLKRELAHEARKEDPHARAAHRRAWIKIHKQARARSGRRDRDED